MLLHVEVLYRVAGVCVLSVRYLSNLFHIKSNESCIAQL